MADGTLHSEGSGATGQPPPAQVPHDPIPQGEQQPASTPRVESDATVAAQHPGATRPDAALWPAAFPPPAPVAGKKATQVDWKSLFASASTHLAHGLAQFGKLLGHLGKALGHLGRRVARLSEVRPTPLQQLALLGGLAMVSIFGALAFPANPLGQACVIAFVPGLCIVLGILGTRWYGGHELDQHRSRAMQNAVHAIVHLKRSVRYVDDRLSEAQGHLESGSKDGALIEVVRAKTATELSLGAAEQASRQWELLSGVSHDDSQTRARMAGAALPKRVDPTQPDDPDFIVGSVARIEDEYTLVINRGAEHGVALEMVFAVLADGGDQIIDPETGAVIGALPVEKLRVKVIEVQPRFSRAATFRTFTPTRIGYPAMSGYGRMAASDVEFDAIDESISKMLETELAEPLPMREKIANARPEKPEDSSSQSEVVVDIGDRVRQVH